jgi:hypothetical protein
MRYPRNSTGVIEKTRQSENLERNSLQLSKTQHLQFLNHHLQTPMTFSIPSILMRP